MRVVGYVTGDGEIICEDCAAKSRARGTACGKFARFESPGWCDCGGTGPDGAPCRIEPDEGEVGAVFSDTETDCPTHCPYCETFIEESLTGDGVLYVLDSLDEHRNAGRGRLCILEEWAGAIGGHYSLDRAESLRLERWERYVQRECNAGRGRCACGIGACVAPPVAV